jgi:hypothetical protein
MVDQPGGSGNEGAAARMGGAALQADCPVGVGKPIDDADRGHRPAALGTDHRTRPLSYLLQIAQHLAQLGMDHLAACPLPTHRLRNGHLNQIAYSLYLFIRDVAEADLVGWIDHRLAQANESGAPDPLLQARVGLIEPMRNVYGVADKILAMAMSGILIGASDVRPRWLEVGVHLIAVDTLVHNFLHRTGILRRFEASHPYGNRAGGCADIVRLVVQPNRRSAIQSQFPAGLPRFVQLAIWRYCSQQGFDICNGNRLNDRQRCQTAFAAYTAFATEFA